MQMDELRCKTPELVRKEVWTHVLAYNLIRTVMAQAAARHDVAPRSISFKGTLQILEAFRPLIDARAPRRRRPACACTTTCSMPSPPTASRDRPDRFEPRLKKRRRNHYDWLTKPRAEMKRQMAKGVTKK